MVVDPISVVVFFLLGLIVGSFVNVVVARRGFRPALSGRSHCMVCEYTLSWYDLVPVASFLALRGKCRQCSAPISFRYPLVEAATGALFALSVLYFGLSLETLFACITSILLVGILSRDLEEMIIPNELVYPFVLLSFVTLFFGSNGFGLPTLLHVLAGPILFVFFAGLWAMSKGKWMGFGDAKLALGIGWFLGFRDGITAILLGFWVGALYSIVLLVVTFLKGKGKSGMKRLIPFAPFLIFGFFVELFTDVTFLPW